MKQYFFLVAGLVFSLTFYGGCTDQKSPTSTNSGQSPNLTLTSNVDAVKTIASLKEKDKNALNKLTHFLTENYPHKVKVAALTKLGSFSSDGATTLLHQTYTSQNNNLLRNNSLKALVNQNTEGSREVLSTILTSSNKKTKILIIQLIGTFKHPQNLPLLEVALKDQDSEVRHLAEEIENKLNKI